jgi:hypothetical protein
MGSVDTVENPHAHFIITPLLVVVLGVKVTPRTLRFKIQGSGLRVKGLGFRV